MSKAVIMDEFGGLEKISIQDVVEPHAGPRQIRVRVTAAGLNPMDWVITANAETAARFGLTLPVGFGTDYAGIVDEVGEGVTGFEPGDRVYGCAMSRTVAEFVVVEPNGSGVDEAFHTPDSVDDTAAAALDIAARTACAVLDIVDLNASDTVLIGGAAGGVGIFTVQLARRSGARVIGTSSESSFDYLRQLGAEPVAYGEGLVDRVRALALGGITAAIDLFGTEALEVARELGVDDSRIALIAAAVEGVKSVSGASAAPGALEHVAELVATGDIKVPIAAVYPFNQIREAAEFQAGRHAKGKVVVTIGASE